MASQWLPARPRLPITPSILQRVSASLKSQEATWDRLMIWAAMNLCVFGFLHSGEICCPTTTQFDKTCHLMPSDLTVDNHANPTRLSVCVKALKTDPFRLGITLVLGATQWDLCPLPVILPYVAVRGTAPGPLFQMANGAFLTRERFVKEVRSLLQLAGLICSCTQAIAFGLGLLLQQGHLIQTLGRWRSSAYLSYIRLPRESLAQVSTSLASLTT